MNYHAERHALIEYLRVKLVANDWHAVSDAANDLRVLDAQWAAIPKQAENKLDKIPQREFRCECKHALTGDRCIQPSDHHGGHSFSPGF